ncbi:MAG TPA: pantoate--beta-alanine ligase [Bacteroidetes bacterium]|nr:pantoate--beta-alanine ligase [Candidatus Limimorpha avicola]
MHVFNYITDIQKFLKSEREKGHSVGLVPTMGALHEGHLSLVRRAEKENDIVVASVFVNPVQFNNSTDFEKYPRTPERDIEMLQNAGCDAVFVPSEKEIYPVPVTDKYDFGDLERVMEGVCRPGHFNGVAIVVRKLFEIVMPDRAYFGEKDFQQQAIIRKLVADLSLNLTIVPCDIVREKDGLAMSSRNMRLTPEERAVAPMIYKVLSEVAALKDSLSPDEMKKSALEKYADIKDFDVEYVEITDETNLKSIKSWDNCKNARIFVALQLGQVRLIDNLRIF